MENENSRNRFAGCEVLDNFIRQSGDKAYHMAYKFAGNCDDAHELVQEALYRVMQSWDRVDTSRPLDGWFFAILRHAFFDSRKRYMRRRGVSLDCPVEGAEGTRYGDLLPERGEGIQQTLEREETVSLTRRVLNRMSDQQREVLTLCDMDGLKYEEIAENLRLPLGTVRSRISRARQAFRGQWSAVEVGV